MNYHDVRRKNHRLCSSQPVTDEPYLPVEPLHPVLTSLHVLCVVIVRHFGVTYVAVEGIVDEVHELINVKRRKRLVALGADIPFIFEFL